MLFSWEFACPVRAARFWCEVTCYLSVHSTHLVWHLLSVQAACLVEDQLSTVCRGELEECLLASVWVCVQHVYSLASICFYDCLPCACMWHIGFASTSTHTNRQWVRPPILPSCSVGSHSQICQASVDVSWMWHATHCKGETQIAKLFLRGIAQLGLKDGLKDSEQHFDTFN